MELRYFSTKFKHYCRLGGLVQQGFAVDRQLAFDGVKYPNSWQILRKHQILKGRPLKSSVMCSKETHEYEDQYR